MPLNHLNIRKNRLVFSLSISLLIFLGFNPSASATGSQSGITYHGRIIKPSGEPLQSTGVQFRLQIRTAGTENCVLFEELHTKDLSNTAGVFAVTLNDGNGTRTDSTGYTIDRVFANRSKYTIDTSTCVSGTSTLTDWQPNSSDGRRLQVYFKDPTMTAWEPMPAQTIDFVPMAIEAKNIGGFSAQNLLRVEELAGPIAVSAFTQANYTELMDLILGTSTQYAKVGQLNGAALPSLIGGQAVRWNGSAWQAYTPMTSADETDPSVKGFAKADLPVCGANEFLKATGVNAWSCVAVAGGAGGTVTSIVGGTGLTGGTITSTGTFAVDVGTTANKIVQLDGTAKLPAVDGSALTNITGANILGTINGSVAIDTTGEIETTGNVTSAGVSTTTVAAKTLELYKPNNAFKTTIIPLSTLAADYTLTLPPDDGAANQVLQTNGSGVLTWATPLTSGTLPVATTGAQGIMQVGTGLAVTTGTVSADFGSTTGKVVEGDDDRLNPAPVIGDALKIPRVTSGGIAYENVTAATVVTSGGGVVNGGNTLGAALTVGTNDAQSLAFETNNATAMTILSDGKVGIGTTSPSTKLHIEGSSANTLKIVDGNQSAGKVLTSDANGVASWANAPGGLGSFTTISSNVTAVEGTQYIVDSSSQVTLTLPATCSIGSQITVMGINTGGWKVTANAGQYIMDGGGSRSPTAGSVSSANGQDTMQLTCVAANTKWLITSETNTHIAASTIQTYASTRYWSDGTYATTCYNYKNPGVGYSYQGSTGNGTYRIDVSGTPKDVYCDMTGGGYTFNTADTGFIASGTYYGQFNYNLTIGCSSISPNLVPEVGYAGFGLNCNGWAAAAVHLTCINNALANGDSRLLSWYYGGDSSGVCINHGDLCPGTLKLGQVNWRCK